MRPAASGHIDGWFRLTPEQRDAALEHTRGSWADDATWSALPEHARIFAALTLPMVQTIPDRVADTFACLNCQDSGFQVGRFYGIWFCAACDKGLLLEAGHWRRIRFPTVGRNRVASAAGKREFDAYAASKPHRAERVRKAIAELVQREREKANQEGES